MASKAFEEFEQSITDFGPDYRWRKIELDGDDIHISIKKQFLWKVWWKHQATFTIPYNHVIFEAPNKDCVIDELLHMLRNFSYGVTVFSEERMKRLV